MAARDGQMVTADTNIVFYALAQGDKTARAETALSAASFLSAQVLNEYAFASRRKWRRDWAEIGCDIALLRQWVPEILPIDAAANSEALRIAEQYQLAFFDALMIAVALINGATVLYSEDMQHGLIVDDKLTIIHPFLPADMP